MDEANIGESERYASGILGGMLVLGGLTKRGLGGLALAAVGAALIERGLTGWCRVYGGLGIDARDSNFDQAEDERINEASEESFPASDAPSWTASTSVGPPRHG